MKTIESVRVFLDSNQPEYMDGVYRCGGCEIEYSDGSLEDNDAFVDNKEFHSEGELIEDIAKRLNVSTDIVELDS